VDEYKTSSVCPRYNPSVVKDKRIITCDNCQVTMHRDSAGAHNIARILRDYIRNQTRPNELHRPCQDGQVLSIGGIDLESSTDLLGFLQDLTPRQGAEGYGLAKPKSKRSKK
ncbi:hypothetical protein BGX26_010714, partial [Mortierella sp. AD094]